MLPSTPRALLTLAVAAAVGLSACGDDSDDVETQPPVDVDYTQGYRGERREVAETIEGYWEAFLAGDSDRICEYTTRPGEARERCEASLEDFTPRKQPQYELRGVRIRGEIARASLVPVNADVKPVQVQLRRLDGGWQVLSASLPL